MTLSKGRGHLHRDLNTAQEQAIKISERRPFLVERIARVETWNWEYAGDDTGATRRPVCCHKEKERERVENEVGNFSGVRSCRVLYAILWDLGVILSMIKSHWRKRVSSSFENDYSSFCMDDKP